MPTVMVEVVAESTTRPPPQGPNRPSPFAKPLICLSGFSRLRQHFSPMVFVYSVVMEIFSWCSLRTVLICRARHG